jgi:hypothetical protein
MRARLALHDPSIHTALASLPRLQGLAERPTGVRQTTIHRLSLGQGRRSRNRVFLFGRPGQAHSSDGPGVRGHGRDGRLRGPRTEQRQRRASSLRPSLPRELPRDRVYNPIQDPSQHSLQKNQAS